MTHLVREWSSDKGAEVSGAAGGLRGRLCLMAVHPRPREVNLHAFIWRELTLVGAWLYDREDFERAVQLVADGTIPAEALISRIVPLADAPAASEALESGGDVMKILVECA